LLSLEAVVVAAAAVVDDPVVVVVLAVTELLLDLLRFMALQLLSR
jgi:hypothetical protein